MTIPQQTWTDKVKYNFVKLILDHQKTIDIGLDLARSIHNFALSKSPLSFLEGGMKIIVGFSQSLNGYSYQFFNQTNGWEKVIDSKEQKPLYSMFESVLKKFPFKHLPFRYDNKPDIGIYYLPCGEIGFDKTAFWFQPAKQHTAEEINKFFIDEKMKKLTTNFFSIIVEKDPSSDNYYPSYIFDLKDEEIKSIPSETATKYIEYISSFIDKDIRRSLMLIGPPGTGKTTLAQTIVDHFKFKTLKFKYDPKTTNLTVIQFLVGALGIESIILDDFDQTAESETLLEFLTWVHNNTKLVLLVSNTLKHFHPAILRPERVDEILYVNHLDEIVVINIFGESNPELVDKIKHWPIAFINELHFRMIANPDADFAKDIEELDKRVKAQSMSLK